MSVDEVVRLLLGLTISISVLGISIQIMRLLGTFNSILQDLRYIVYQIGEFLGKVKDDYGVIMGKLGSVLKPLDSIKGSLLMPIARLAAILGGFVEILNNRFTGDRNE
jgi:hypothetical protein